MIPLGLVNNLNMAFLFSSCNHLNNHISYNKWFIIIHIIIISVTFTTSAVTIIIKAIATEAGPYGVRCNCLVPGGIETDLWTNWGKRMSAEQGVSFEEWKVKALSEVPLRTISQPEDIGNLALFLASDESRTITGQSINCDAGSVMIG